MTLVRPGDLVEVQITALDPETGAAEATLDQEPIVEAALLALENRTGRVLAMVGGYSFDRSKFNRATQAYRQLGSLFKGVLYAAAIDQGYTTTSTVLDEPVSYDVGPEQDLYEPINYDDTYEGSITLRRAFEKSRNVPAVWLMNEVGPERVIDFARRLGFSSPIPPFPVGRARVGRGDVAGGHERLLSLPQPGDPYDPVSDRADPGP